MAVSRPYYNPGGVVGREREKSLSVYFYEP